MKANFTVIMTTYKRPTAVLRAVDSIITQSKKDWQAIIVIDDTESDYRDLVALVTNDNRFVLIKNDKNHGKNASVNKALNFLRSESFSGYIVFLDDDDWLERDCLKNFSKIIATYTKHDWFVTNRTDTTSHQSFTKNKTGREHINYYWDCLLTKRFTGDATHCLNFSKMGWVDFPTSVKNAEEWLYFSNIATILNHFIYKDIAGTISSGYSPEGLTDNYHKHKESRKNVLPLIHETFRRRLFNPIIWLYLIYRLRP